MTSYLLLGLFSWILMGAATGWLGARYLPGHPRLRTLPTLLVAVVGALAGGLVGTLLDFGGLAVYDPRSLATATLAALLATTAWRLAKLAA